MKNLYFIFYIFLHLRATPVLLEANCESEVTLLAWNHFFSVFLSFIELPFIEIPTPVISPASAPVPSPASWARLTKARLAEQVLGMPLRQKKHVLVVSHSHIIWHQKRQYLIAQINWFELSTYKYKGHSAKYRNQPCLQYVRVKTVGVSGKLLSADISSLLHAHVWNKLWVIKSCLQRKIILIQSVSEITQIPPVTK